MTALYLTLIDEPSDKEKFTIIYDTYKEMMYQKAMSILKSNALAEEAVQESFFKIAKNISKFSDPNCRKTASFIVIIVKTTSLDKIKTEHIDKHNNDIDVSNEIIDISTDTLQNMITDSGYERLVTAIDELKDVYSETLKLKLIHEYSNEEIAQALKIEKRTVEQRILRGKKILQKKLEEDGYAIK